VYSYLLMAVFAFVYLGNLGLVLWVSSDMGIFEVYIRVGGG
jgi:hypothetical protein